MFLVILNKRLETLECLMSSVCLGIPSNYLRLGKLSKCTLIWLNRVWRVWRVSKLSNPIHFSYILAICKKCFFFIPKEGLDSLEGLKGFWPLSNYLHLNNLSKFVFIAREGLESLSVWRVSRVSKPHLITNHKVLSKIL